MLLAHKVFYSFIYSLNRYLWRAYYVPGMVLVVNKKDKKQMFQEKEPNDKQIENQDSIRW